MVVCRYSVVYSPYGVKVLFFNLCCILAWCSWFLVAPLNQNERTGCTSPSSTFLFHVVSRWKNRDEWEGLGGSSRLLLLFLFASYFSNGLYVWCWIHPDVPFGLDYQHLKMELEIALVRIISQLLMCKCSKTILDDVGTAYYSSTSPLASLSTWCSYRLLLIKNSAIYHHPIGRWPSTHNDRPAWLDIRLMIFPPCSITTYSLGCF